MFSKPMSVMLALSACILSGCGGGDRIVTPRAAVQNNPVSAPSTVSAPSGAGTDLLPAGEQSSLTTDLTRAVGGARRGIQSIYFLALEPSFANDISDKLNSAADSTVEIELSPAYDTRNGVHQYWLNAQSAITRITARNLNLVVDFGFKTVGDKTPSQWGDYFYSSFFKANWNKPKLNFVLEVANEDSYSSTEWNTNMTAILKGLRDAWQKDSATKSLAFPYSRITVRRCPPTGVPSTFKIDSKDKDGFQTETEYHFPSTQAENWTSGANAVSNDGQTVYRPGTDPNPLALDKAGKALLQVTLADFKTHYTNKARLLWHPALHRWPFSGGAYRYPLTSDKYADTDKTHKDAFLALLTDFLK